MNMARKGMAGSSFLTKAALGKLFGCGEVLLVSVVVVLD